MTKALLALLIGAAAIGGGPILVRLSEVGPCATAWWRMALALPVFGLWALLEKRHEPAPRGGLALAGLFFAMDLCLFHWGIVLTTVTNSTLLSNLAPVFVTLAAWLIFRERVGAAAFGALGIALAGAALLVLGREHHGSGESQGGSNPLLGDVLSFIAAFAYAGYQLTVNRVRKRATTAEFMWWSCLACAAVVGVVALISGETLLPTTGRGWVVLIALALIAQVLGQGLISWALKHLPQAFSTVALLFQPLVAAAIAWPLFDEAMSPVQLAGGAILIAGVLWSRLANPPTERSAGSGTDAPAPQATTPGQAEPQHLRVVETSQRSRA